MSAPVTINFNRGLKGMFEKLVQRLPNGQRMLDGGLRDVMHKAIDQNPEISKQDFTAVEMAERLGILKPERKRRIKRA